MTNQKSNGAAQSGPAKADPTKGAATTPKVEETKPEAKTEQPKPPTVEERKNRHELFDKLLGKHEIYSDSKKKMEEFIIGSDENSQSLLLKDAKGNQFNTGNPVVIKEVIDLVRNQIKMQCGQVEEEILNFVV
jgi:hypothetical protein